MRLLTVWSGEFVIATAVSRVPGLFALEGATWSAGPHHFEFVFLDDMLCSTVQLVYLTPSKLSLRIERIGHINRMKTDIFVYIYCLLVIPASQNNKVSQ